MSESKSESYDINGIMKLLKEEFESTGMSGSEIASFINKEFGSRLEYKGDGIWIIPMNKPEPKG